MQIVTKFLPVLKNNKKAEAASLSLPEAAWKDICRYMNFDEDVIFGDLQSAVAKLAESQANGFDGPEWKDASFLKITLEVVEQRETSDEWER